MIKKYSSYIILFYIILSSGMATTYFRGITNTIILFIISFIYIFIYKKNINKNYYIACFLWFIYITLSLIKYQGDNSFWPFSYFVNFTIVYFIIRIFRNNIFEKSENIIYYLTITSLCFFTWQVIDFSSILSVWQKYDISGKLFDKENFHYHHSFFYTIIQYEYMKEVGSLPRNAGFCWEPGAFSCFIIIALFFLLCKKNGEKKISTRLVVYITALITTQSTTGLLAFFIIAIWYFENNYNLKRIKYIVLPILLLFITIAYVNIPILGDKINNQLNKNLFSEALEISSSKYSVSLDRFLSLKITFLEFINNPILGIGANNDLRWSSINNINVSPTSGIGNIMARYGLFGIIPFVWVLIASSKKIATLLNYKGNWYFLALIAIFGFSFNIIETPFFLSLIFFSVFYDNKSKNLSNSLISYEKKNKY